MLLLAFFCLCQCQATRPTGRIGLSGHWQGVSRAFLALLGLFRPSELIYFVAATAWFKEKRSDFSDLSNTPRSQSAVGAPARFERNAVPLHSTSNAKILTTSIISNKYYQISIKSYRNSQQKIKEISQLPLSFIFII